jgi:hypothetical protein
LFGQDFQKRKDEEIEEILKKNPYNDIWFVLDKRFLHISSTIWNLK